MLDPRMLCVRVRVRVLARSRDAVEGADRETGSVFAALVSRGSGVASIWDQSVSHPGQHVHFLFKNVTVIVMLLYVIILMCSFLGKV